MSKEELDELRQQLDSLKAQLLNADKNIADTEKAIFGVSSIKVEEKFKAVKGDLVDEMLAKYINNSDCKVPITRLGGGFYLFGTKKIYAKIMNGKLVVRVGGGFMVVDEFINTYSQQEMAKL